jgi:hypothetical protein
VIEPMPPRITMVSTLTDCRKLNDSGLTKVRLAAKRTPMAPAKEAPTAKAPSLSLFAGMPMAVAASSSSRMAAQARPILESSSL